MRLYWNVFASATRPAKRWWFVALSLSVLTGCASEDRVSRYPATGSVFVDGKPAEGVRVKLHPEGQHGDLDALRPQATTNADGSFALGTYEDSDGAPAGRYIVTLFWPDVPPGPTPPDDRLEGRYADPQRSSLSVTVNEEPTELIPFQVDGASRASLPIPTEPVGVDGF